MHVLDRVVWIVIFHLEDVTAATDESAAEASIPLGSQVDVADVGVRYVMSSCFLLQHAVVSWPPSCLC